MAMQLNGLVLPDQVMHTKVAAIYFQRVCMVIKTLFQAEAATAFIHTFMRYVIAAYVICLRRLSTVVRNQFPTDDALVEAKLLTEAELGRWYKLNLMTIYKNLYLSSLMDYGLWCVIIKSTVLTGI